MISKIGLYELIKILKYTLMKLTPSDLNLSKLIMKLYH